MYVTDDREVIFDQLFPAVVLTRTVVEIENAPDRRLPDPLDRLRRLRHGVDYVCLIGGEGFQKDGAVPLGRELRQGTKPLFQAGCRLFPADAPAVP